MKSSLLALLACLLLPFSALHGQALGFAPPAFAVYSAATGLPVTSAASYGALNITPPAFAAYCQASLGALWTPCVFGGSSGAVSSLTTTGTSGAATLTGGVLNIPNYATSSGGAYTNPSGLVENWPQQEGQGSAFGNAGYDFANPAAATAVTWTTGTGFPGKVATFNGTSSYAVASSATATSFTGALPFSACAWINIASLAATDNYVIANLNTGLSNIPGWGMEIDYNGKIGVYLSYNINAGNDIHVTSNIHDIAAGTTNQVCFTYDGSLTAAGTLMYLNGAPTLHYIFADGLTGPNISSALPVFIGAVGTSPTAAGGLYFPGTIGGVKIFNRLLPASAIAAMYSAGAGAY